MNTPRISLQSPLRPTALKTVLCICLTVLTVACAARPAPTLPGTAASTLTAMTTARPSSEPGRTAISANRPLLSGLTVDRFAEIDAALEAAWDKLNPAGDLMWTPARTPFFASQHWPTPQTVWTSYAFAYGRNVNDALTDGQHVAQPWAVIIYDAASNMLQVTALSATLIDTGEIQGVRPLNEADIVVLKRGPEMQRWVLTHPKWPQWNDELSALQQYYVTWLAHNGVIGARITPAHEAFINKWVNVTVN